MKINIKEFMSKFTGMKEGIAIMKKVFYLLAAAILFLGCLTIESSRSYNHSFLLPAAISTATVFTVPNHSVKDTVNINDLVYHDYGTGVKLTKASTLTIPNLDLSLKEETAEIYVIELTKNNAVKLCDYHQMQDITYTPAAEGIYQIVAVTDTGAHIDLTLKAAIKTTYTVKNTDGLILLQ